MSRRGQPRIERHGWRVLRTEWVELQGVTLERFETRKILD